MSVWFVFFLLVSLGVEGQSEGSGKEGEDVAGGDDEPWQYVTYLKTVRYAIKQWQWRRVNSIISLHILVKKWITFYKERFWPRTRD